MTQIEMLLLSLLCEKDYHAYELEQTIEKKNLRTWIHIGFSSIYNSLNKLEKNQYIVSRLEKGNGSSSKRVYSIKDESRELVKENIFNVLSQYKNDPNDFKIAFLFSDLLNKNELNKALSTHKTTLIEKKELLMKEYNERVIKGERREEIMLLERTITLLDADILWLDRCICENEENVYISCKEPLSV